MQAAGSSRSETPEGREDVGSTDHLAEQVGLGSCCRPQTYLGGEGWIALVDLAQTVQHLGQL